MEKSERNEHFSPVFFLVFLNDMEKNGNKSNMMCSVVLRQSVLLRAVHLEFRVALRGRVGEKWGD